MLAFASVFCSWLRLGESLWCWVPLWFACLSTQECSSRARTPLTPCPPPPCPCPCLCTRQLAPSSRLSARLGPESSRAPFCPAPLPSPDGAFPFSKLVVLFPFPPARHQSPHYSAQRPAFFSQQDFNSCMVFGR